MEAPSYTVSIIFKGSHEIYVVYLLYYNFNVCLYGKLNQNELHKHPQHEYKGMRISSSYHIQPFFTPNQDNHLYICLYII